jgi:hypothetical protein
VAQPLPVGVRDDGALVADHRLAKLSRCEEPAHRLHHAAGHDDDVQAGGLGRTQRCESARPQPAVLPHEGAVEVGRDDLDVAREIRRENQPFALPPVAFTT